MKTNLRKFLITGAILLAIMALAIFPLLPARQAQAAPMAQATIPTMASLPEAVCVLDEVSGVRTCDIWATTGSLTLPGATTPVTVWGFAVSAADPAVIPGPVLRAVAGETLVINLHNLLADQNVSLAFPGMEMIPDTTGAPPYDGVSDSMVTYTLPGISEGTFLYEAGMTENGARQVSMGLSGPLVVMSAPAPVEQELILFLEEVDPSFNANPSTFILTGFKPRFWLLNGKVFPETGAVDVTAGSTLRLRYLNAGVVTYSLGLLGLNQRVVAADGVTILNTHGASMPSLAPGQTLETLVTIPSTAVNGMLYPIYSGSLIQHNNNQRLADMRAAFGGMMAFLRVGSAVTPGGQGPVTSGVTVTPAKSNGLVDLSLSANVVDDNTTVAAVEYYIDTVSNLANPMTTTNPATATIPAADLVTLASGNHTVYVRGMDADGNWGAPGSFVFTLDKAGPIIQGAAIAPNPTNGLVNVTLSGTANDTTTANSNIAAAEYRINGGAWMPMTVSTTTSPQAGITATIPAATIAALAEGVHTVEVRALDEYGNWTATPAALPLTVDKSGPVLSTGTLTPNSINLSEPLPASVRLDATLTDQPAGAAQSPITNVEGFIDTQGAPGTGFALYPSDGLLDETVESVYYNIPGSRFANLSAGVHHVLVVGKDKAGNYGPAGSIPITIIVATGDLVGPTVTNVVVTPNPAPANQRSVTLTARATDTASNIASVVWFLGTDPSTATLYTMKAVDGKYNSLVEDVTASINISRWASGTYQISVRARDARGNWGPIVTIPFVNN